MSKRIDAPYRSGNASDWIKVKCAGWREANKERWRLFEKGGSDCPGRQSESTMKYCRLDPGRDP